MYLPLTAALLMLLFCIGLLLRWKQRRSQRKDDVRRLRAWMAGHQSSNHAFQLWKYGLSQQESEVLLDLASGYCTSLNWNVEWLLSSSLDKAPALQSAVETGVSNYLESVFVSLQTERDVHAFYVYQAFEKKPTGRKSRAMVEALYESLSRDGLIPKAKRLLGRVTRRKANLGQKAAAIQHAIEHNPGRTMELLKEVLSERDNGNTQVVEPSPKLERVPKSGREAELPVLAAGRAAESTA